MTTSSTKIPETADQLLFELGAMTSAEAKRQWRAAIKKAWNNCCAYCGTPPIDDKSLTIDHVRPKSKGGEDRTTNCIPACKRCNHAKGSEYWLAWFRMQPFYTLENELKIKHWLATGLVSEVLEPNDSEWLDSLINKICVE